MAEQETTYTPFGDPDTQVLQSGAIEEEHSFIGERYDASTGLLFLNARYYDPDLGRFLQPDWWEVRQQGVGTNRYAYSFNDPINRSDRNGHLNVFIGGAQDDATSNEPVGRFASWLKRTFRGLFESGTGVNDVTGRWTETNRPMFGGHSQMAIQVQTTLENHPNEPLNIFGHSRGGAAAIRFANELNSMGIVADFVMSIDPVANSGNRQTLDNDETTWVNAYVPNDSRVSIKERRQAGVPNALINPDTIARLGGALGHQPDAYGNFAFPRPYGGSGHMSIIDGRYAEDFYSIIFGVIFGYSQN